MLSRNVNNLGLTEKVENLIPWQIAGRTLEHAVVVLVRIQHIPREQKSIKKFQILLAIPNNINPPELFPQQLLHELDIGQSVLDVDCSQRSPATVGWRLYMLCRPNANLS